MKKVLVLFLTASIIILSGCGKRHIQPWRVAKQYAETAIDCTIRRDIEGIKEMFCEEIQETHDLDEEIEELLDFIDGNIISYDEPDGKPSGSSSDWDGVIDQAISGYIDEIKTDKGGRYRINVYGFTEHRNHKEYIGITCMDIIDKALYDEKNSYPDEAEVAIGDEEVGR